jgi:hypothetical protein
MAVEAHTIQGMVPTAAEIERFWSRVEKRADGCWLWTGGSRSRGYGTMALGGRRGKTVMARRLAFLLVRGHSMEGDHRQICATPGCLNPNHLLDRMAWEERRAARRWRASLARAPRGQAARRTPRERVPTLALRPAPCVEPLPSCRVCGRGFGADRLRDWMDANICSTCAQGSLALAVAS